MCIIIDANLADSFFGKQSEDLMPIWHWIETKDGCIVCGGKLTQELIRNNQSISRLIRALNQAGKAYIINDPRIEEFSCDLTQKNLCKSNDTHVIALASISGARLLASNDADLINDFKNISLIRPKGKVYRTKAHTKLLSHTNTCPKNRKR